MKLNLGCGPKLLDGFVNVDLAGNWSGVAPDVVADITQRLPFDDESADEVHAYHVIEHIERFEAEAVLADWARVLKPGGLMILECPCLDKIIGQFRKAIEEQKPIDPRMTIWGLYGDPNYKEPRMMHRWCYSINELSGLLSDMGMKVKAAIPKTHIPFRDMRIEGIK